jgi:hypothetical protein
MSLLVRLAVWLGLLIVGFALLLLPSLKGHLGQAFSEAGSSVFTLGYAVPASGDSTTLEYLAAFTGLVVIGLQVGYLPTLYAAFNKRETEVTLLASRAGVPSWRPEILVRSQWGIRDGDIARVLETLFVSWERWAAEVAESHTTYFTLTRFRSPRPPSHWLTSLIAVLDAAALHLALAPSREPNTRAATGPPDGLCGPGPDCQNHARTGARSTRGRCADIVDVQRLSASDRDAARGRLPDRTLRRRSMAALSGVAGQLRRDGAVARQAPRRASGVMDRTAALALDPDRPASASAVMMTPDGRWSENPD